MIHTPRQSFQSHISVKKIKKKQRAKPSRLSLTAPSRLSSPRRRWTPTVTIKLSRCRWSSNRRRWSSVKSQPSPIQLNGDHSHPGDRSPSFIPATVCLPSNRRPFAFPATVRLPSQHSLLRPFTELRLRCFILESVISFLQRSNIYIYIYIFFFFYNLIFVSN